MASILKIDQLQEKTVGHGINLQHSLNNSSGNEIISAAGSLSGNVDLSGATFPAGHVIKKHYVEYNSVYSDLNCLNTLIYLNFQLDITPVSENSNFFIFANISAAAASQHNYLTLRLYQTSPTVVLLREVQPMSFNYPYTFPTIMTYHHFPNTTNTITYRIGYIDTNNDSGDLYINRYNTNSIVQTTSINAFEFSS